MALKSFMLLLLAAFAGSALANDNDVSFDDLVNQALGKTKCASYYGRTRNENIDECCQKTYGGTGHKKVDPWKCNADPKCEVLTVTEGKQFIMNYATREMTRRNPNYGKSRTMCRRKGCKNTACSKTFYFA